MSNKDAFLQTRVERVAEAIFAANGHHGPPFHERSPLFQEDYYVMARAAISAMYPDVASLGIAYPEAGYYTKACMKNWGDTDEQ